MPVRPPEAPSASSTPEAFAALVEEELGLFLRRAVGLRVVLSGVVVLLALAVAWVDPSPWRRAMLGVLAVLAVSASAAVELVVRRRGMAALNLLSNLVGMAAVQAAMILATGGLESPALPVMLPLAVNAAVLLGRPRAVAVVVGTQLAAIWAMAVGQTLGGLPDLRLEIFRDAPPGQAPAARMIAVAAIMTVTLILGSAVGAHLRGRAERTVRRALGAREDQLRTWSAYTRDLEALSGEIAHELKNPLASVKGLAALLARDLAPGKSADRLAVLRTEVDRMQEILEEFLTFSRPLSPLALAPVDLSELCVHTAELHEGLARGRGVSLTVAGAAPPALGDRRKLTQILVNLVQNALDAAPAGSEVALRVGTAEDGVAVEVLDRGPGLPAGLEERVFEAGVTTRPHGSGIGLAISLALARQHGGDLTLTDRPGGGALARLRLPVAP